MIALVRRRQILAAAAALAAMPFAVRSQSRARSWQIGLLGALTSRDTEPYRDAFVKGLTERGYVNGKDFILHERIAEGDNARLPALAAELVNLKVDVIFAGTTPVVSALQQAGATMPIVFVLVSDPVKSGFAESLARPGRNITGMTNFAIDLTPKRLELLKELMPALSRVAILVNPHNPLSAGAVQRWQPAAKNLGLTLVGVNSRTAEEISPAFATMARERIGAVLITGDTFHFGQRREIAQATIKHKLASISPNGDFVEMGGLVSYGVDLLDPCRRAAAYVDKILKGARPGDLPIEQPTKFEMFVNRKTAKALGIAIPQSILVRADRMIE